MIAGPEKARRPSTTMVNVASDVPSHPKDVVDVLYRQSLLGNAAVADVALRENSIVQRGHASESIQAKLTVSEPGDALEQEADRVAEQVVSRVARSTGKQQCPVCGGAGTCTACQQKRSTIQPKHKSGESLDVDPEVASEIAALRGGGQPLPRGVRDNFEAQFGQDFAGVRIHDGGKAADLADAVGARAFTARQDIIFGRNEYAPDGMEGQLLLAHELTHVVQQGSAVSSPGAGDETLFRQSDVSSGGGPDPCFDLLQAIIEFLNEVAQRFNDALNDPHDLFRDHRTVKEAHPDYGSWDGHRDRYNYTRDNLRRKIAEWDSNDDCRAFRLSKQQQEDLEEAREFGSKEFPAKPSPSMREAPREESESVWDKLRKYLPEILVAGLIAIAAYAAAAAVVACFASGACEFAAVLAGVGFLLVLGISAVMRAAGVQDKSESSSVAINEDQQSNDDERPT
ncbi:eCIS core domain-containing protein [Paraburkholderia terrae]